MVKVHQYVRMMIDIKWDVEGEEVGEVINLIMIMAEGEVEVPEEKGAEIEDCSSLSYKSFVVHSLIVNIPIKLQIVQQMYHLTFKHTSNPMKLPSCVIIKRLMALSVLCLHPYLL